MSLRYILLGLIELQPAAGYDLVKTFNYSMLFYWHATGTQIYRTLKELQQDGLITGTTARQGEYPPRTVFSITEAGQIKLSDWLKGEPKMPGFKHPFLIKFSLSGKLSKEELVRQIGRYRELLEEKLAFLRGDEKTGYLEFAGSDTERLLWEASVENGIMYLENEIAWAEITRRRLTEEGREGVGNG